MTGAESHRAYRARRRERKASQPAKPALADAESPPTQPSLAVDADLGQLPAHSPPVAPVPIPKAESPFINAVHLARWPGPILAWFRGKYGVRAVHDLIDAARQALADPKVKSPKDS